MKRTSARPTAAETRIAEHRATIKPLHTFPAEHQATIAAQIAAAEPPLRWRPIGATGDVRPYGALPNRAWYEWHWSRGIDPDSKREPLPAGMRQRVIERDGYVCQLCGGDVEPGDVHIDHIKPYSKGGKHTFANLQVAHSRCNISKGARI